LEIPILKPARHDSQGKSSVVHPCGGLFQQAGFADSTSSPKAQDRLRSPGIHSSKPGKEVPNKFAFIFPITKEFQGRSSRYSARFADRHGETHLHV